MLLDQLTVRAFRGIRTEVQLDLRARLTLIQAPNGVGKTSLCDAIEWLFTGEVYRLRDSVGRSKGKGIQNIFERSALPYAEAVVTNSSNTFRVRREGLSHPNKIETSVARHRWRPQKLGDLLARITPENLPHSTKGLQAVTNRRSWFRATRFLDTAGLHFLVDSDEDSNEVRDLVFSDFLGVGELQRRERDLRKVIGILGARTRFTKEVSETEEKIHSIENRLKETTRNTYEAALKIFRKQLNQLAAELSLKSQPNRTADEELAALEETLMLSEWEIRAKQDAFADIRKKRDRISELPTRIADLEGSLKITKVKSDKGQDAIKRLERLVHDKDRELSKLKFVMDSLLLLPFDEAKGRLQAALFKWQDVNGRLDQPVDVDSLRSSLEEVRGRVGAAEKLLSDTSRCESSLSVWQHARSIERQALEDMEKLVRPMAEERSRLESELRNNKAAYDQIEVHYEDLTKPLEALRIVGREFVEEASSEQHCPLCGVDHGTPDRLREAIAEGLEALPATVVALLFERNQIMRAVSSAEQQLKEWSDIEKSVRSFADNIDQARRTLVDAEPLLEASGFSLKSLDDEKFVHQVTQEREARERDTASLRRTLLRNHRKFDAALELKSIAGDLKSLAERLKHHAIEIAEYDFEKLPPAEWVRTLDHFVRETNRAVAKTRANCAAAEHQLSDVRLELAKAQSNRKELASKADEIAQELNALKLEQEEFQGLWEKITGDHTSWDARRLDEIKTSISNTTKALASYRPRLELVRKALEKAKEIESKEVERELTGQRLTELRADLGELKETLKRRDECEQGANLLRLAKDSFVKTQIQPLCDVITALYVRAQGAPFINRIDSTRDDGPLRWMARIGDFKLEDTAQMSLGQRQDLALSIFLARARELGGTFFLDEPLLHLDDLNRVALMDVLRTIVVEKRAKPLRLVVTTANQSLVRHCREKFAQVDGNEITPAFRAYRLVGDPKTGISTVLD